ncbi:MAG: RHS repeat-associated core domain-containing protein, partial [Dehalococcoidia bacterium]
MKYGSTPIYSDSSGGGAWLEQLFSVPASAGASGSLTLTGTSPYPDIAYVERLDPPTGRGIPRLGITRNGEFPIPASATGGLGVDMASGAFLLSSTDLVLPGLSSYLPLDFSRGYSSQAISDTISAGTLFQGAMGPKWSHSWAYRLQVANPNQTVILFTPSGPYAFNWDSSTGVYVGEQGVNANLSQTDSSHWTLTTYPDDVDYQFSILPGAGFASLTALLDRNGNQTTLSYDSANRLTTITDAGGRSLTLGYDGSNRITSVHDNSTVNGGSSRSVGYYYNGSGDLNTVTDVRGGQPYFQYDNHWLKLAADALNNATVRNYVDSLGRVGWQHDAAGQSLTISFNTPAAGVTTLYDQRNNPTQFYYDAALRVTDVVDANGTDTATTYGSDNTLASVAGPQGRESVFGYDGNDNLTSATDALNDRAQFSYDGQSNLLTATDALGHVVVTNGYDANGNRKTTTDGDGNMTTATVNSLGQATAVKDGRGNTSGLGYTAAGDLTSVTNPLGKTTTITRDTAGRATSVSDPLGHASTYAFDPANHLLRLTDAKNNVTQFSYDADGNQKTITDANNHTTTYAYTPRNQLQSVTDAMTPTAGVTAYAYDPAGNLTTVTDPLSQATTSAYDVANRLTSLTNAMGKTTTLLLDANGNATQVQKPAGLTDSYSYDLLNRLSSMDPGTTGTAMQQLSYDAAGRQTKVTDANGHSTTYGYSNAGRLTSVMDGRNKSATATYDGNGNRKTATDRNGHTTTYAYDAANRLSSVTDAMTPTAGVTGYGYDDAGRLTSVSNALSNVWQYQYDTANRPLTVQDPLGNTTTYSFDPAGNATAVQTPNQSVATANAYHYDARNRLSELDPGGSSAQAIRYAYDASGRRTSMTDPSGTTSYGYDSADRLTCVNTQSSQTSPCTGSGALASGCDDLGRRTSMVYPGSGHQVSYAYSGPRGQLGTVTDWNSKQTTYSYDRAGLLQSVSLPNGITSSMAYDAANRLTSISHSQGSNVLLGIGYTLDDAGNRMAETLTSVSPNTVSSYAYDNANRLTAANYASGDVQSYSYDLAGNRIGQSSNGVPTTNSFDRANRMLASGSTSYGYDLSGNQTSKTAAGVTTTFAFDALNRLTGITGPTTASYTFNGDGMRTGKTVNGTATNYALDPTGIGHVLSDGNEYVWGQGLINQTTAGGASSYALSDGSGSIRQLTDGTGNSLGSQTYDAFGGSRTQSGSQLPFGYAGEQLDAESGLIFLRARSYDASTGRFLGQDPMGAGGGYSYAGNNPGRYSDPSGRDAFGSGGPCDGGLGVTTSTGGCSAGPAQEAITQPFQGGPPPYQFASGTNGQAIIPFDALANGTIGNYPSAQQAAGYPPGTTVTPFAPAG